jgi:hypothetical protein
MLEKLVQQKEVLSLDQSVQDCKCSYQKVRSREASVAGTAIAGRSRRLRQNPKALSESHKFRPIISNEIFMLQMLQNYDNYEAACLGSLARWWTAAWRLFLVKLIPVRLFLDADELITIQLYF